MDDETSAQNYETSFNSVQEPTRRNLIQIAAMLGSGFGLGASLATGARVPGASAEAKATKVEALERKLGLPKPGIAPKRMTKSACELYNCADTVERIAQKELSYKKLSESLGVSWFEQLIHNARRNLGKKRIGKDTSVENAAEARATLAFMLGARCWHKVTEDVGLGRENQGHLSWNALYAPKNFSVPDTDPDPNDLTHKIKKMSRLFGAAHVGIAEIDQRWIYSETCRNIVDPGEPITKPIVFRDVGRPTETDNELIIPQSVKYAVVFVIPISRAATQIAPATLMSHAATSQGNGLAGLSEIAISEAIRTLGYNAIPCKKGVGQSVPMAIDAGLGQVGLHGHLITPDYGAHVVIGKVLTDMPLVPDKPIDFGTIDYCMRCGLCSEACPPSAIPRDIQKTIDLLPAGARRSNHPEAQTWYIEGTKCLSWWAEAGAACRRCIEVCPYTQFNLVDYWGDDEPRTEGFWELDLPYFGVEDQPPTTDNR